MKTETILTRVNDALRPYAAILNAADSRDVNPFTVAGEMRDELVKLRDELEQALRNEAAASKGSLNALKSIRALLDENKDSRKALSYAWIDGEGRQCCCDGFRAFRLKDHLPLEDRPENAGDPIDLGKIFPSSTSGMRELPMPSANDIKSFIAIERAKVNGAAARRRHDSRPNILWSFGDEAPTVNVYYLLDVATVFPNVTTLYWTTITSLLYFSCDDGDGVLLPVRDDSKKQPAPETPEQRAAIEAENERKEQAKREADERAEIHKAHEAAAYYRDEIISSEAEIQAMREQAKTVTDPDERKALALKLADAFERNAKAKLREHEAILKYCPDAFLTTDDLEKIVKRLYAKERLAG